MSDTKKMKLAVVLFNLGGPDSLEAVQPFLHNLFSDPAIIGAPGFIRKYLAKFLSSRRAPEARGIYEQLGGKSPLLGNTQSQSDALETALSEKYEAKCFIAMRYWHPFTAEVVAEVKEWAPQRVILLPLYPQFSTTTSASSLKEWRDEARRQGLATPGLPVCCYPTENGFIDALVENIRETLDEVDLSETQLLFSAHGLPKRVIDKGDPYQWQVEQTAAAIVRGLNVEGVDWSICYQSRVGPLEWIGPATDDEIRKAGNNGKSVVLCPIGFVAENSETVYELDIEYRELAERSGVKSFKRVPTVSAHRKFIGGLGDIVDSLVARDEERATTQTGGRLCPSNLAGCPCRNR